MNVPSERKHICGGLSASGWSHTKCSEWKAELFDGSSRPAAPETQQPASAHRHPGKHI